MRRTHSTLLASVAAVCLAQTSGLASTASYGDLGLYLGDTIAAAGLDEIIALSVNDRGIPVLTVDNPQSLVDHLIAIGHDVGDLSLYFNDSDYEPVAIPLAVADLTELGLAVGMARAATVDDMKVFTAAIIRAQTGVDDHRRIAFVPGAGVPFAAVAAMALGRSAHADL